MLTMGVYVLLGVLNACDVVKRMLASAGGLVVG